MTVQLSKFIINGVRPATLREAHAFLDECRSVIAQHVGLSKPAQATTSAAKPNEFAPRKGELALPPAKTGNGVFKPTQIPTLSRSEFDKLSAADKNRFFKESGKLI